MKFVKKMKKPISRVDVQVSLFMAVIVVLASLSIFAICYKITYDDMIDSLKNQVNSIYNYFELSMDKSSFYEINIKEDMNTELYKDTKKHFEEIKNATGVRYLYTAKATPEGELIYVIDGLSEEEDFRYPGDLIEAEIQGEMRGALEGQSVMPDDIKTTEWGKIFIAYLPIHDSSGIIGVIGIEFDAEHQYDTYFFLRFIAPIIILMFTLISVIFAVVCFRRISNPSFQDLSNTDQLTQLKNQNAFEIDLKNIIGTSSGKGYGIIVVDLNKLKQTNDTLGHQKGDQYLQMAGTCIEKVGGNDVVRYRTGGDEFALIIEDATEEKLKTYETQLKDQTKAWDPNEWNIEIGLSLGGAIFDPTKDQNLRNTYHRADEAMYENKKSFGKK